MKEVGADFPSPNYEIITFDYWTTLHTFYFAVYYKCFIFISFPLVFHIQFFSFTEVAEKNVFHNVYDNLKACLRTDIYRTFHRYVEIILQINVRDNFIDNVEIKNG